MGVRITRQEFGVPEDLGIQRITKGRERRRKKSRQNKVKNNGVFKMRKLKVITMTET